MTKLITNSTLSHYRIVSKIGAGGMGEVYLAQDTKLDRKVALKILPAEVAADRSRMNRFVQEAKAVSALNHPNIITIYEIDETDSGHFIATEFIDGETVRECLRKAPLTVSEALDVATQTATALAAAHQTGIIHRDIKPENVMVRVDGLVKVLDFGLAKLTTGGASDPEGTTRIQSDTQPGMILGTAAYMSPEQARGQAVDPRTDVWSLGVLLYEMLSRRPPFLGETASDTLANILHREPDALNIGAQLHDLTRIVEKMLAKKLTARYSTMAEAISDLKSLQRRIEFDSELQQTSLRSSAEAHTEIIPASTASKPVNETAADSASSRKDEGFWVAVLPFKYPGSNPDIEALAEGLSEDIVTGLSRFPHLRVIARSSTSRFTGASGDVRSIGKELGARYVVEGSLRHAGAMLRVTVQLLDAMTGAHLWAETYNRGLKESDIFSVQDDLTDRVVATIADSYGVLVRSMAASVEEKPEAELTAADWLLRQYRYRQLLTPEEHAKVRDGLERFVEREPKHAAPWACLAQLYVDEFVFKFNPCLDSLDRALVAARRSVDLDRTFQYGNQILAQVHFFRRDVAAFRTTAEQAMSLNTRDTDTLAMMGLMLVHIAEFERGANIVRRAMDLNPNHAGWYHFAIIWEHLNRGDYEKALARITRVNMPGLFWQPLTIASICGLLGRSVEAAAAVQELRKLDPDFELHVREYIEVWHYSSGLMDRILEGLSKAGVEIVPDPGTPSSSISATGSGERPTLDGFWVAVLPFKHRGSNPDLEALAESLSEDIITGLSRFSCLRVIARSSTLRFTSESADVRSIGKQLGARYVMDGSLRQAGSMLRLVVQLVDASTGAHLWAETYDRAVENEKLFALQDDLVPRIVSTVADWYGVLTHSMSEAVRQKPLDQLTPYEALLRSFGYYERVTSEEQAAARSALERAVEQAPSNADAWAMLSMIYGEEHRFDFNLLPDPLGRSLQAARRAVSIAPTNHFAHLALAQALFFRKEFEAFRASAERAIALNPMDGATLQYLAHLICFSGDWEYGCQLAEQTRQLNPNHPGWYWAVPFFNAYRNGDYVTARSFVMKGEMANYLWTVMLGAVYGQLGERDLAERAVSEVLALVPDFAQTARRTLEKWYPQDLVEGLIDGLRKAGLEIAGKSAQSSTSFELPLSSETRLHEGFWVAVLPFRSSGTSPEVKSLADALSEEIVTGLSRFSYLRVIARTSTSRFTSEASDLRSAGKELGARYVMEGSLRQAGSKLRLAVQLVDATTGAHLWAENYERSFDPDSIFELQDDLVPRIVSTVADQYGALVHSMSESLRGRTAGQYSAHEAVLRAFGYLERITPEEHAEVREILEAAVAAAPDHSDCLAQLTLMYTYEHAHGYNVKPDPLGRAQAAAQRAVAAAPTNHLAHHALATVFFFQKDFMAFRPTAERALALNTMDASTTAFLGVLTAYSGDWEYALRLMDRAMHLNPHHAGWYYFPAFHYAYRKRDYRGALEIALKINMPGYFFMHTALAAVYGQLGEQERARAALRALHSLVPDFGAIARQEYGKWLDAELTEHMMDGLRKAGLEIAELPDKLQFVEDVNRELSESSDKLKFVGHSPSIAVLPFVNLSNDPDNDYFCDGLAEELLNALSKIDDLKVAARTSAFSFKGKNANVSDIGEKLSVTNVLEGSVRKSGNRLRISVQLVNAADGYQLWSERYDREMKDIFDLQDEITLAVVDALKLKLFDPEKAAVLKRHTDDAEVHELFLKGRYYSYKYTAEGWKRAIEFFEQAIEKQPDFAPAYAGIAASAGCLWFFGLLPAGQTIPQCKKATSKALKIDDKLADAYLSQAITTFFHDWEWEKAEQEFKQSIALSSTNAEGLSYYALFLAFEERFDEAISCAKRALEIDPLSPLINMNVGWTYFSTGRLDDALNQAGKMIEIEPDFFGTYWLNGAIHLSEGEYDEAIEELKKAVSLGGHQIVLADLGSAYGLGGKKKEAAAILDQLLELRQREYVPAICIARVYSRIGEDEKTIEWLEKAFEERNGEVVFLKAEIAGAADNDSWSSLGSYPKVIELLEKMKLPDNTSSK